MMIQVKTRGDWIDHPGAMRSTFRAKDRIRMKRAEEYRKKAEEAEAMAAAARDPSAKQAYLEIAQQWRQLAEHAEHMER